MVALGSAIFFWNVSHAAIKFEELVFFTIGVYYTLRSIMWAGAVEVSDTGGR